jgi:hypothetical protein
MISKKKHCYETSQGSCMTEAYDDSVNRMIHMIAEWLRVNQENQRAVRPLTDILEVLEWAQRTMNEMREEGVDSAQLEPFLGMIDRTYGTLVQFLPTAALVNIEGINRVWSATSSFTSTGLLGISATVSERMPRQWLAGRVDAFVNIQEKHNTVAKVRSRLELLQARNSHLPNVVDEYDLMIEKAFYYRGNDIDKTTSAGIAMRNVLEHVKGKLLTLAGGTKGKKASWISMTEKLGGGIISPSEKQILLEEERTYDELHSALSDLAKNRAETDTKIMAVQVITHLFTLLTLVKL